MFYQDRMQVRRLKYFSRPPWRSYYFLVNTYLLLVVTFFPIQIIMDFRLVRLFPIQIIRHSQLSLNSSVFWLFTPIVTLIVLWGRVWKAHSDVYQAIHSTSLEGRAEDARIAIPLDALAYMLYAGFGLALSAVGLTYVTMAHFARASLHR
jgi:hypothetical protein